MKKIFLLFLLVSTMSYGQFNETNPTKNRTEVKFNLLSVSLGALHFEFERTLTKNSSIGMSFRQAFKSGQQSEIAAFYRHYIGNKYASGFFIEGFGMYNSIYEYQFTTSTGGGFVNSDIYEYGSDFALGLGIGYKYVSKKGLILQAHLGAGRNIINGYEPNGEYFVGKAGVSIGWSF